MPITPLPPAPLITDTAFDFDVKAFARVNAEVQFVTEANALEANVNAKEASATASSIVATAAAAAAATSAAALLFNAATNYAVGQAAISGVNFMTYRNTLGGVNATDPASDTTGRWVDVGAPPVTVVDVATNFTFQPGVLYRIVGSCNGTIPALGTIARGDVFSAINTSAAYAANILSNGHAVQGVVRDVSLDTDAVGRALSLLYSGPADGLVAI